LIETHEIVIDRPRGSRHPRYPDIVYPFHYGYLAGTSGGDGQGIDVCLGSLHQNPPQLTARWLSAVICTVDSKKADAEIKLLINCTSEEIDEIERFFNRGEYLSGIILRRDSTGR
jgi:inorganic pyrophosphatase